MKCVVCEYTIVCKNVNTSPEGSSGHLVAANVPEFVEKSVA